MQRRTPILPNRQRTTSSNLVSLRYEKGFTVEALATPHPLGARHGEKEKWRNWNLAIKRRQERATLEVQFVPFSVEVGGAWGPAAKRFFNTCVQLANDDRDIDLYHWSSARFSAAWIDTISVLLAKGRARVGVADAATDWPRRIRDMQYLDHESLEVGA